MMQIRSHRAVSCRAFSLIEMVVTISIIALLAVLLFAGFQKARSTLLTSACSSNLRQFGIAATMYMADNHYLLPMRIGPYYADPNNPGSNIFPYMSYDWMSNLAPYLNMMGSEKSASVFLCPADPSTNPKEPRTYRYNAPVPSPTDMGYAHGNYIPYSFREIASPPKLPMLFCIAYTAWNPGYHLFDYYQAIWEYDSDIQYPANQKNVYPRPHFNGNGVNILYYDGHVAATPCPLSINMFHFDNVN